MRGIKQSMRKILVVSQRTIEMEKMATFLDSQSFAPIYPKDILEDPIDPPFGHHGMDETHHTEIEEWVGQIHWETGMAVWYMQSSLEFQHSVSKASEWLPIHADYEQDLLERLNNPDWELKKIYLHNCAVNELGCPFVREDTFAVRNCPAVSADHTQKWPFPQMDFVITMENSLVDPLQYAFQQFLLESEMLG